MHEGRVSDICPPSKRATRGCTINLVLTEQLDAAIESGPNHLYTMEKESTKSLHCVVSNFESLLTHHVSVSTANSTINQSDER